MNEKSIIIIKRTILTIVVLIVLLTLLVLYILYGTQFGKNLLDFSSDSGSNQETPQSQESISPPAAIPDTIPTPTPLPPD